MREVINDMNNWRESDEQIAIATVIRTWGSAPRKTGAKLALTASGKMSGSVSGGCVEGATVEEGMQILESKTPKLLQFGVADETAWEVGLACGGSIEVYVEPLDAGIQATVSQWLETESGGVIATHLADGRKILLDQSGETTGSIDTTHDAAVIDKAREKLAGRKSGREETAGLDIFYDVILPPPSLIMIGGVHISVALIDLAHAVGFKTIVIDPRRAFASKERFGHAGELYQVWPQKAFEQVRVNASTAVAMLTHDPKIDDPAIAHVVDSPAFYLGALGSNKTHKKRVARLQANGFTQAQIDRIHAPIGLDINAQSPEEIALSVMAEIIGAYRR